MDYQEKFVWGIASSAAQIEGAQGRGVSVWDDFCRTPGAIADGSNIDLACDHLNRASGDVDLIAGLGVDAYRFSISWPRLFPDDTKTLNEAGLDFYDKLTDNLIAKNISPWVCVYHWDTPSHIQNIGGWSNRDIVSYFSDFCAAIMERIGDRVPFASPFNEPNVPPWVAFDAGDHAPGRLSKKETLQAMHNICLAHGTAVSAMRSFSPSTKIGSIFSLAPIHPKRNDSEHYKAAAAGDAMLRRVMLDPLILGTYPELFRSELDEFVVEGDMEKICQPLDFFGLNHYSRVYIEPDATRHFGARESTPPDGAPVTSWGWEIDPDALIEQLYDIRERYPDMKAPIYITENGACFDDQMDERGEVIDDDRIAFFEGYLDAVSRALELGFDIRGYFFWSILDNFEWNAGYSKRFGLVHVDFETMQRTPKKSYQFVRDYIALAKDGARKINVKPIR